MKRRSIALSAAVALLSMVITSCADSRSGNSSPGEKPTSSPTPEVKETFVVIADAVPTVSSTSSTTTTIPTTEKEETTTDEEKESE